MKLFGLLIFSLLCCTPVFGQGDVTPGGAQTTGSGQVSSETDGVGFGGIDELLKIPEVAELRDACQSKIDADAELKKKPGALGECLWDEVQKKPEVAKAIEEKISTETGKNFEGLDLNNSIDVQKDPAVTKLETFLFKKLEDGLYGTDKIKRVVGQGSFFELYKTALGKNIISAYTSVCIEAQPLNGSTPHFYLKEDDAKRRTQRNNVVKSLSTNTNDASRSWQACITAVNEICNDSKYFQLAQCESYKEIYESASCDAACVAARIEACRKSMAHFDSDEGKRDEEYTKGRACRVNQFVREHRQAILATDSVKGRLDDKFKVTGAAARSGTFSDTQLNKVGAVYTGQEKGASANALTTLTSGEALNDAGLQELFDNELAAFKEECMDFEQDDKGKIVLGTQKFKTEAGCEKYLTGNRNDKIQRLAEWAVRSGALSNKIKEQSKTNEGVTQILKEQGYEDAEIDKLLALDGGKFIRKQLTEKYDTERENILNSLSDEIKRTTASEGNVSFTAEDGQTLSADQKNLQDISQQLASKADDFKQLLHFNNIITGFLQVSNNDGETSNNVTPALLELENSAYSAGSDANGYDVSKTEESVRNSEAFQGTGDADFESKDKSTNLENNTIKDNFLDYGEKEEFKRRNPSSGTSP